MSKSEDQKVTRRELRLTERSVNLQFKAHARLRKISEKAVTLGHQELNRRLNEMNEFRNQLERERLLYLTKTEWERLHVKLEERVAVNQEAADRRFQRLEARQNQAIGVVAFLSVLIAIVAVVVEWLKK